MYKDTTTTKLIDALRDQFCPQRPILPHTCQTSFGLMCGPQFTSANLATFLKEWGLSHCTSSPRYPQSNGKAEAAVKSTYQQHGQDTVFTKTSYPAHYCNTGIHHLGKMGSPLPRNYLDNLYKITYQLNCTRVVAAVI